MYKIMAKNVSKKRSVIWDYFAINADDERIAM